MFPSFIRLPFASILSMSVLAFLVGCGSKEDLNKARATVETSLEAWKKAEDPRSLVAQGIEFTDPDWTAGHRLLDFTLKPATSLPQQGPRVIVLLDMKNAAGATIKSEVAYEVILGDTVKIGRDAFHDASQ